MRISRAKKVFALLALLLCQLTIFGHQMQHQALQLDESCQICLHAPGLDAAMVASKTAVVVSDHRHEAAAAPSPVVLARSLLRYQPIRAPPLVS